MKSKLFVAIATLVGMVIGAGFLGIPYVVSKAGFLVGLGWMISLMLITTIVKLAVGEIVLSTKSIHQLPGYASKYLGKKTKLFVFLIFIFGIYTALIAYLIGEGESLSFLITGGSQYALYAGIGFWMFMAVLTFRGIKSFKKIEPYAVIAVFVITFILGIVNFNKLHFENLAYSNMSNLFLPFGVILFAFLGTSAIPEMRRILINEQKLMKKAIIIGSIIPLLVYVVFTIIVLGLYGQGVSEIATISFGKIVTLLGMFTMFTAFFAINLVLQDMMRFDFNFRQKTAWAFATFIPLILFVLIKVFSLAGFVRILSIGGAISGGLICIVILLIHEHLQDVKTERKPEFKIRIPLMLKILFIIIFLAGILYEFF